MTIDTGLEPGYVPPGGSRILVGAPFGVWRVHGTGEAEVLLRWQLRDWVGQCCPLPGHESRAIGDCNARRVFRSPWERPW